MTAETASQREQRKWEKQEQKEKKFSIISNGALNIFFFKKSQMRDVLFVVITDALLKHYIFFGSLQISSPLKWCTSHIVSRMPR